MRTAAFGMSGSGTSLGFSDIVFCKAARINVKERLVKGAEREKWGEESRGNASDIVRRDKSSTTGSWVSGMHKSSSTLILSDVVYGGLTFDLEVKANSRRVEPAGRRQT